MGLVKEESDEGEEDPIQERGQEGGRDGGPDPERATDQSDSVVIEGSQSRERVREMRKVGTRRREGRPTDSTPLNFTKDNDRRTVCPLHEGPVSLLGLHSDRDQRCVIVSTGRPGRKDR